MMFLTLQTALLLLAAYVLGAICGCGVRRLLAAPNATDSAFAAAGSALTDQPMIEVMAGPEPSIPELSAADRFERALIGPRAPRFKGRTKEPEATPAKEASAATPLSINTPEANAASAPQVPTPTPGAQDQAPVVLPVAAVSGGVTGTTAPLAPTSQQSADDLTRIRGIDLATSAALADLGVSSYARLAAFTRADVERIEARLGAGRVSRENWIEQAQLLANGRPTAFARQLGGNAHGALPSSDEIYGTSEPVRSATVPLPDPEPVATPEQDTDEGDTETSPPVLEPADAGAEGETAPEEQAVSGELARPAEAASAPADDTTPESPAQDDVVHDFRRIRGIDAEAAALLHENGVLRFEDIANWRASEVSRFESLLGESGRISRENWIEQAQVLAKGGETAFSRRLQLALTVEPAEPAPLAEVESTSEDHEPAQAAPAEVASLPSDDTAPESPAQDDVAHDFLRIRGIDAEAAALLSADGVLRFEGIANWRASDVSRFESLLGDPGRISRENWIEQAQVLAKGGETAFSSRRQLAATVEPHQPAPPHEAPTQPPDRATPSSDEADSDGNADVPNLAGLRSVRSPLLTGGETTSALPNDDLKRIRGIGVLIEKKLNSLGITSYSQIANWTAADVDRISRMLDFKGRIERECWIEQARILASGGHTAFSSRKDRE